MKELIKNIEQWAEERNLIGSLTSQKQRQKQMMKLKLMEEFGEF